MLHLYNYLTHAKEKFSPIIPNRVGMYVCGPTVYGDPHLGHARSAVVFDVLYRYLQYRGYKIRYVRNITDVGHLEDEVLEEGEDKLAKTAKLLQKEPMEIANYYTKKYHSALEKLNCLPPSIEPLASGHILEEQEYIAKLLEKDWAYEVNGSVYFNLEKFLTEHGEYGKLSGKKVEDLLSSQRTLVKQDEKRSALDFALWKKSDPDHIMKWKFSASEKYKSAEAAGFPGWHIECSAMSEKYLGIPFDIHGGGLDLQFPHHEAEIAQCYAHHKKYPAHYWLYNNMITIENRKMSKSLGNFITLEQFFNGSHSKLQRAYAPDVIRFFLIRAHYRSVIDVSDDALFSVARGMTKLTAALHIARDILKEIHCNPSLVHAMAQEVIDNSSKSSNKEAFDMHEKLCAYMDDDIDTPSVIAELFTIAGRLDEYRHSKSIENLEFTAIAAVYYNFYINVLGVQPEIVPCHCNVRNLINAIVQIRHNARKKKDFELSDQIRDALSHAGITAYDNPDGSSSWIYDMMNHDDTL